VIPVPIGAHHLCAPSRLEKSQAGFQCRDREKGYGRRLRLSWARAPGDLADEEKCERVGNDVEEI